MKTSIGNLLRRIADMVDNGECGVDGETLAKVAELHLQDHAKIEQLTRAVTFLMDIEKPSDKVTKAKESKCKVIDMRSHKHT